MEELRGADVSLILYPLSAFRAMSKAALTVYVTIRKEESPKNVISLMQTRAELYDYLDYHAFEQKLDAALAKAEQPCAQRPWIDTLRTGCREALVEKPAAGIR